ncbi:MAG TPA: mechanosensitive ion channel domain-containing protein [Saprospiraceae bacterium]|nr:mechanosensitive ion channel domain-containing protein [Saprospiraceae bacterium]
MMRELFTKFFESGYANFGVAVLALAVVWYIISRRFLPRILETVKDKISFKSVNYYVNSVFLLLILVLFLNITGNDLELFGTQQGQFVMLSQVVTVFLIIQAALFTNYLISNLVLSNNRDGLSKEEELISSSSGTRSLKYVLVVIALRALLHTLEINYIIFRSEDFIIDLNDVLKIVLIVLLANFISFLFIKIVLFRYYSRKDINVGAQYSINQLVRYLIYLAFTFIAIESIGISLKLVWGGLAALLVGIGFGLQNVFADFIAGIILLFERSIEVGDTVQLQEGIGMVKKIGLRTSEVELRDSRVVVVPNASIVNNSFLNWDKNHKLTRFTVTVGVAYGSDVEKVRDLLIQAARENRYVVDRPSPFVRFVDFGDSSLVFELLFWSTVLITIEDVKSDLRFSIDKAFRENDVRIPFPQRDLWIKQVPPNKDQPAQE